MTVSMGEEVEKYEGRKKITFSFDLNPGGKKATVLVHRGWRMLGEMKKVIQNSKKHPPSLRAARSMLRLVTCKYAVRAQSSLSLFF